MYLERKSRCVCVLRIFPIKLLPEDVLCETCKQSHSQTPCGYLTGVYTKSANGSNGPIERLTGAGECVYTHTTPVCARCGCVSRASQMICHVFSMRKKTSMNLFAARARLRRHHTHIHTRTKHTNMLHTYRIIMHSAISSCRTLSRYIMSRSDTMAPLMTIISSPLMMPAWWIQAVETSDGRAVRRMNKRKQAKMTMHKS